MRRGPGIAILAGLALLLAGTLPAPTPAMAQDDDAASTAPTGKEEFLRHCAFCHGLEGYGNGPLADAMKIAPSDLTRIAAKHGGEFPAAKVSDVIRNGGGVLGHGSTTMLAWGNYFAEKRKPEVARARIKALVDYLESIQQK